MDIFEIGYYYGGGKNLEKIYDCLVAINSAPKDERFWEYIEKKFKEFGFVDAWGGINPTVGLLMNWKLVIHKKMPKISYTTIVKEEPLELSSKGRKFLELSVDKRDEFLLKHALEDGLLGFLELVYEKMSQSEECTLDWLIQNWNEKVGLPTGKWSSRYSRSQNVETRRSWAKYFGLIREKRKKRVLIYLTEKGIEILRKYGKGEYPEVAAVKRVEKTRKEELSHTDIITLLQDIGKALGFTVYRTPLVNIILPENKQLRKKVKQLDVAWQFHHPFLGDIWIPIEVQKGGSIEDALTRLNIVSDYSHKIVIVCDENQVEEIQELIERERRIPLEKLVIFSFDEVAQLKNAVEIIDKMKNKLLGLY